MPSRDEIKPRVIAVLQSVTFADDLAGDDASDLTENLGLTPTVKTLLAVPYTEISTSYPGGIEVSMTAAGDCKKVKNAIDLVHRRSNGTY